MSDPIADSLAVRPEPFFRIPRCNPMFVASALLMVVGCFALSDALAAEPGGTGKLAVLLGAVNLYEVLVLSAAHWLIRSRRSVVDGRLLLVVAAVFLGDATFLIGECLSSHGAFGLVIGGVAVGLIPVKLWVIARILDTPVGAGRWMNILVRYLAVFVAPLAFGRLAGQSWLDPRWALAGWWLAGVVIATGPRLVPDCPPGVRRRYVPDVQAAMVILPAVSLMAHLIGQAWVNRAGFALAYTAPVLIGLSVWLPRMLPRATSLRALIGWRIALPVLAIALSLDQHELSVVVRHVTVTAGHLAAGGAVLACIAAWIEHGHIALGVAGGVLALGGAAASTPRAVYRWLFDEAGLVLRGLWLMLPRSQAAWGLIAVLAAFALLGGGVLLHLLRRPRPAAESRSSDPWPT